MGVTDLWTIFDKFCTGAITSVQLEKFKNRTLAVDLSCWIMEAWEKRNLWQQHLKPHLYVVFTRTLFLYQKGIKLLFVLEGNEKIRVKKRYKKSNVANTTCSSRKKEKHTGNQVKAEAFWSWCVDCERLLQALGVAYIFAQGDAEALCASLNSTGVVDGVITSDSDAFLYGAEVVLRHISIEHLKNGTSKQYLSKKFLADVPWSNSSKFENQKKNVLLTRKRLVALSVLLGCDFHSGVNGLGPIKALQFIASLPTDVCPLSIFGEWSKTGDRTGAKEEGSSEIEKNSKKRKRSQKNNDSSFQRFMRKLKHRCLESWGFPWIDIGRHYLNGGFQTYDKRLLNWNAPDILALQQVNKEVLIYGHDASHSIHFVEGLLFELLARIEMEELVGNETPFQYKQKQYRLWPTAILAESLQGKEEFVHVDWRILIQGKDIKSFKTFEGKKHFLGIFDNLYKSFKKTELKRKQSNYRNKGMGQLVPGTFSTIQNQGSLAHHSAKYLGKKYMGKRNYFFHHKRSKNNIGSDQGFTDSMLSRDIEVLKKSRLCNILIVEDKSDQNEDLSEQAPPPAEKLHLEGYTSEILLNDDAERELLNCNQFSVGRLEVSNEDTFNPSGKCFQTPNDNDQNAFKFHDIFIHSPQIMDIVEKSEIISKKHAVENQPIENMDCESLIKQEELYLSQYQLSSQDFSEQKSEIPDKSQAGHIQLCNDYSQSWSFEIGSLQIV